MAIKNYFARFLKFLKKKSLPRLFFFSSWSIAVKISVALLLTAIIPMSFIAYYNLQRSIDSIEASEYYKLELMATNKADLLDRLLLDNHYNVNQISTEDKVVKFLAAMPAEQEKQQSEMRAVLERVFRSKPNYDAVYLLDREGRCLASTDPAFIGENYAFREYFQSAIAGKPFASSFSVGTTIGKAGLYFAKAVRSSTGENLGVAVLKVNEEDLWVLVSAIEVNSSSAAFLIDEYGIFIAHPNRDFLYKSLAPLASDIQEKIVAQKRYGSGSVENVNIPDLKAIVDAKQGGYTSYYSPLEKTHQTVGFAPLKTKPWVLGVYKPKIVFTAPINHLIWQNVGSVLVVGGIASIGALCLSRSIAKPIRLLIKAARSLHQGSFTPDLLNKVSCSQDDVGELARVFLDMAQEVKGREQKLKQEVTELHIEIDEVKKARQVAEVTKTDYFDRLQQKAKQIRNRSSIGDRTDTGFFKQLQQKIQHLRSHVPAANR